MGVEYLPQFQSVTNVMNTEYGENNNLLTFVKKNFLYRPRSYRIGLWSLQYFVKHILSHYWMIRAWAGLDFIRAKNNRTGMTGVSDNE